MIILSRHANAHGGGCSASARAVPGLRFGHYIRLVFVIIVIVIVVVVVFVVFGFGLARAQLVELVEVLSVRQNLSDGCIPHDRPLGLPGPRSRRINTGETRSIVSGATADQEGISGNPGGILLGAYL